NERRPRVESESDDEEIPLERKIIENPQTPKLKTQATGAISSPNSNLRTPTSVKNNHIFKTPTQITPTQIISTSVGPTQILESYSPAIILSLEPHEMDNERLNSRETSSAIVDPTFVMDNYIDTTIPTQTNTVETIPISNIDATMPVQAHINDTAPSDLNYAHSTTKVLEIDPTLPVNSAFNNHCAPTVPFVREIDPTVPINLATNNYCAPTVQFVPEIDPTVPINLATNNYCDPTVPINIVNTTKNFFEEINEDESLPAQPKSILQRLKRKTDLSCLPSDDERSPPNKDEVDETQRMDSDDIWSPDGESGQPNRVNFETKISQQLVDDSNSFDLNNISLPTLVFHDIDKQTESETESEDEDMLANTQEVSSDFVMDSFESSDVISTHPVDFKNGSVKSMKNVIESDEDDDDDKTDAGDEHTTTQLQGIEPIEHDEDAPGELYSMEKKSFFPDSSSGISPKLTQRQSVSISQTPLFEESPPENLAIKEHPIQTLMDFEKNNINNSKENETSLKNRPSISKKYTDPTSSEPTFSDDSDTNSDISDSIFSTELPAIVKHEEVKMKIALSPKKPPPKVLLKRRNTNSRSPSSDPVEKVTQLPESLMEPIIKPVSMNPRTPKLKAKRASPPIPENPLPSILEVTPKKPGASNSKSERTKAAKKSEELLLTTPIHSTRRAAAKAQQKISNAYDAPFEGVEKALKEWEKEKELSTPGSKRNVKKKSQNEDEFTKPTRKRGAKASTKHTLKRMKDSENMEDLDLSENSNEDLESEDVDVEDDKPVSRTSSRASSTSSRKQPAKKKKSDEDAYNFENTP
ncbi:hypothetical protein HK096_006358, partial [Nowakowskiella sp. JEL0078]